MLGGHVFGVRLFAGLGAGVPIAVQDRAAGQVHYGAPCLAGGHRRGPGHPIAVLAQHGLLVAKQYGIALAFGQQGHHSGEKRRLRAGEVIGTVAIGHEAVAANQVSEVVEHVPDQWGPVAFLQAQHGEVRIPVVHLPEPPAGHEVRVRQRNERRANRGPRRVGAALQHGPQRVEVAADAGGHVAVVGPARGGRRPEVRRCEGLQVEAQLAVLRLVVALNVGRGTQRRRVHKRFAVRVHPAQLHRLEQTGVELPGRGLPGNVAGPKEQKSE